MFLKISNAKHGYKAVDRYFQVSKTCLKYFTSSYSASVLNSKPLKIIEIKEIENIELNNDDILKGKQANISLNFVLRMTQEFYKSNISQDEIFKVDEEFHFGFEEKENGVNFIKIIFFIKNILY